MSHSFPTELQEGGFKLGADLATPGQYIVDAVDQLNINLAAIGCEPAANAEYIRGSWQTIEFSQKSPPFTRAVQAAASSIIWRRESLADTLPPVGSVPISSSSRERHAAWVPTENLNPEELLAYSTEGITWEHPQEAAYRNKIVTTNGSLLMEVIGGLASKGYAPRHSKSDIRKEFNEVLDSLVLRTSYHCIVEERVIARMMRKSEVTNALSPFRTIRRFGRMAMSR